LLWRSHRGDRGGEIVVVGTPETVAEHPTSHTSKYLKQVLEQHPPEAVAVLGLFTGGFGGVGEGVGVAWVVAT